MPLAAFATKNGEVGGALAQPIGRDDELVTAIVVCAAIALTIEVHGHDAIW